jgi:hypothetical protein
MPGIISVFKECIDIAKKNYLRLIGLYILIVVIFTALTFLAVLLSLGAVLGVVSGISSPMAFVPLVLIVFIAAILISPVWNGIYYSLALQTMKKKSKPTLGKAFNDSKKVYRKMLWTSVIQTVIMCIVLGIIMIPGLLYILSPIWTGSTTSLHPLLLLSALIIPAVVAGLVAFILGVLFFVAVPLAMLDGSSGIDAIKKSFSIGRKHFWRIIGLLILAVIAYVIAYVITDIFAFGFSAINPLLGVIVSFILTILIESFVVGVVGFLPIVFYKRFVKA